MQNTDNIRLAKALTCCAVDCLEALRQLTENQLGSFSIGILAGHCLEASLKAHLALNGCKEIKLKQLGHDLIKCWNMAESAGVVIDKNPPKWVIGINYSHSRIRFRYPSEDGLMWLPHPEDYIEELSAILDPLVNDLLVIGGRYVEDF